MNKTYIIAEIGNTHEGSLGLAKQFIKAAAACKVDAVKLQTHIFEAESLPNAPNPPYFKDETRKEYFERTAFNLKQYKELKRYANEECGVDFLSSPFSFEAVDLLMDLGIDMFKIPSGEVSNTPLLEYIANTGKKVILSSGMSGWEEMDEAVSIFKGRNELVVLQCTSEYPCPPEHAGLNIMIEMKDRYQCPVGFSDHTLGVAVPLTAVVMGACMVEKHFTLSRQMYGSDAKNSTEPAEFAYLVESIRAAELAMYNKVSKNIKKEELENMKLIFEKSIVANKVLTAGHTITLEDLWFKKPGNGIPANAYKSIVGKKLKNEVQQNQMIKPENIN